MLSKSRFVAGTQCHRLLWWKVHEPNAKELQPGTVLQDLFDQGKQVGELARTRYPGGVLIDFPYKQYDQRVAATKQALEAGAPAIFEACFIADDTFVAIDVLARSGDGYRLIEVKQSTSAKDEHVPDVAVQARVAAACGVNVISAEVMHLNKEYRRGPPSPEGRGGQGVRTEDLSAHTDITKDLIAYLPDVAEEIEQQQAMLAGPIPPREIGGHCDEPRECPFKARCWPTDPRHIGTLFNIGPKRIGPLLAAGIKSIDDLPPGHKLSFTQKRQIRALTENRIVVEPTLREKMREFEGRLGFLDFETVARAIPPWDGMGPHRQAAAQFSYHERQPDGSYTHAAHLAEGPLDSRPPLAEAMIKATARADRVVMYTAFEKTQIRDMKKAVPHLANELSALEAKLLDLKPVVEHCVYHPDFRGSFSLKDILHPLVPELSYNDLVIVDGRVASVAIARLLFVADKIPQHERDRVRQELLDYCERDTWATVRLVEELKKLAELD